MAYVYRYTDLDDNKIKYVGIVYGGTRTLQDRIAEHKKDNWYKDKKWLIEYISEGIDNQSEAEAFESHYITLFNNPCYNIKKVGWGINKYLPDRSNDWIIYNENDFISKNEQRKNHSKKKTNKRYYKGFDVKELIKEQQEFLKYCKDTASLLEHIVEQSSKFSDSDKVLKPMTILNSVEMTKLYFNEKWNKYGVIASIDNDGDLTLLFTLPLTKDAIDYAKFKIEIYNKWISECESFDKEIMNYLTCD